MSGRYLFRMLIALVFQGSVVLMAQQPFEYRYTMDNGLIFPEVDVIFFSKKGDLWVKYSTSLYISRFNGVEWEHFNPIDENISSNFFFVYEDDFGFWSVLYNARSDKLIRFYGEDSWKEYDILNGVAAYLDPKKKHGVVLDSLLRMYKYDKGSDSFVLFDSLSRDMLQPKFDHIRVIKDRRDRMVLIYSLDNYKNTLLYPLSVPGVSYNFDAIEDVLHCNGDSCQVITMNNGIRSLVTIKGKTTTSVNVTTRDSLEIKSALTLCDARQNSFLRPVYLATSLKNQRSYLIEINEDGSHKILYHLPERINSSSLGRDLQGRVWFSMTNGIMSRDYSILSLTEENPEMVSGLHAISEDGKGNLWIGGYGGLGGFSYFDGQKISRLNTGNKRLKVLPGSYRDKYGWSYFHVEQEGIMTLYDGQLYPLNIKDIPSSIPLAGFIFYPLNGGKVAIGLGDNKLGIGTIEKGALKEISFIDKKKGLGLQNILCVAEDKKNRLWMGRLSEGIAVYDPQLDTVKTWNRSNIEETNGLGALSLMADNQNNLWIGTNKGLYVMKAIDTFDPFHDLPADRMRPVALPGHDTSIVTQLLLYDKYLIAGSVMAVHFIDISANTDRKPTYSYFYGRDIPGGGSEQNASIVDKNGFVWIGAQEGAIRIDPRKLPIDTTDCSGGIKWFKTGETTLSLQSNKLVRFDRGVRSFSFAVQSSGNYLLKNTTFKDVFLVRSNGDTLFSRLQTQLLEFDVDYLPPGKYKFIIVYYKNNLLCHMHEVPVHIPRLIGEEPLLYLFVGGMLLFFPFIIYSGRQKQKQLQLNYELEKERNQKELDNLRILTLSNYFNPHFINNTLHWIQSRYRKDPDTAQVVGRLSENVDILFSNTQNGVSIHSIQDEIKVVENYLAICAQRFGKTLDFQILLKGVNDVKKLSYNLPVLSIQIFVENAVEKGIASVLDYGYVHLTLSESESGLSIVIEDNGIGRNARALLDKDLIRPGMRSTETMQNLIEIYNVYNAHKIDMTYEDEFLEGNTFVPHPHGTRVLIFIPKNFKYAIETT